MIGASKIGIGVPNIKVAHARWASNARITSCLGTLQIGMIPFLKYKEGVIPGKEAVKRPSLSQEGKVGTKKRYEAEKRQRKFQSTWQENRPWLDFVDGLMFCTWCKIENVPNCKFVTRSDHFRVDSVREHENSRWHKHYAPKYKAQTAATDSEDLTQQNDSETVRCLKQLYKADYNRLFIKFRNAHAIAKHHKSLKRLQVFVHA